MPNAHQFLNYIAMSVNVVGVVIILVGVVIVLCKYLRNLFVFKNDLIRLNEIIRFEFGSYLVFGLEFFIASDIIRTIIIPTWMMLGMLGSIVLIRTILSYFLTMEIKGKELELLKTAKEISK